MCGRVPVIVLCAVGICTAWDASTALARHREHKRVVSKRELQREKRAFGRQQGISEELAEPSMNLPPHPDDKQARKIWKDTRGRGGRPCAEAGFCGNLKPLDNGNPHPNCKGWQKDCPCSCTQHRPKPARTISRLPSLLPKGAAPLIFTSFMTGTGKSGRGTSKVLTTVDYSDLATDASLLFHSANGGPGEMTGPLPPRPRADYAVVLLCYQAGPLPLYLNYFLRAASTNAPLIHYVIVHSENDMKEKVDSVFWPNIHNKGSSSSSSSKAEQQNIHFVHMSVLEVAKRIRQALKSECEESDDEALEKVLREPSASGYGSKFNDLKPLYGAVFQNEIDALAAQVLPLNKDGVKSFSHWGWMDLDCLHGSTLTTGVSHQIAVRDVDQLLPCFQYTVLHNYLPHFDIITFPDGDLPAIYAAGQLTVFRNIEHFRACFKGTTEAGLICQPGNRLWDEKFTMYHAVRNRHVRVVADFSQQFAGTATQTRWSRYDWQAGALLRFFSAEQQDTAAIEAKKTVKELTAKSDGGDIARKYHDCVSGYWSDWTWKCLGASDTAGATRNMVYKWLGEEMKMVIEYVTPHTFPTKDKEGSPILVEVGSLFHLHNWKKEDTWYLQEDGWKGRSFRFTHEPNGKNGGSLRFEGKKGNDGR